MSVSINNYGEDLTNLYASTATGSADKMKDTLSKDMTQATDEELMKVCKSFESYFTQKVMESMEKMVPKDEEESKSSEFEMFKSTLYQEFADAASEKGDLGLAQILFESMKRNYSNKVTTI